MDATLRAVVVARDPEGQSVRLGYRWFVDGSPRRTDGATLELTGVRKGAQVRVVVVASDGSHDSEAAEATTRVIDRVPTLTAVALSPEEAVTPGQPVSARAVVADPDGDDIDVEYVWYVNGTVAKASGSVFQTGDLKQGDEIQAEIRASDGTNWTRAQRTRRVKVGSHHPEIRSTPPDFREDGVFRYEVVAEDPDGDRRLRFTLLEGPDGMAIDAVLGSLIWRPANDQVGVHPVQIEVRDSAGLTTTQAFDVTVRRDEGTPPADAE
jgi:hypothetical protein